MFHGGGGEGHELGDFEVAVGVHPLPGVFRQFPMGMAEQRRQNLRRGNGAVAIRRLEIAAADVAIRAAVGAALQAGLCTSDVVWPGAKVVGTRAFAAEVNANLRAVLSGKRI